MGTNKIFDKVSELAKKALIDEVRATPKPGLVDASNNGAHKDMSIDTFLRSAEALGPYFADITRFGFDKAYENDSDVFFMARSLGLDAEKEMYQATGGINTHKGMIFSMGLVCLAVGKLLAENKEISLDDVCHYVKKYTEGLCKNDYSQAKEPDELTNGEKLYKASGVLGARGEAEAGFPTIRQVSYPIMKEYYESGMEHNLVMVRTLLYMMSVLDDTNVLKRSGVDGASYVKKRSKELISASLDEIKSFDEELIKMNISPGGYADLLAVTRFIYLLESEKDKLK